MQSVCLQHNFMGKNESLNRRGHDFARVPVGAGQCNILYLADVNDE